MKGVHGLESSMYKKYCVGKMPTQKLWRTKLQVSKFILIMLMFCSLILKCQGNQTPLENSSNVELDPFIVFVNGSSALSSDNGNLSVNVEN